MDNFGLRLREERQRLGLSQEAFGEIGGVKKIAQSNYETGKRVPDARYLSAMAAAGVDVQYVLTGVRGITEDSLAPDEAAIVDHYRESSEESRASLTDLSRILANKSRREKEEKAGDG